MPQNEDNLRRKSSAYRSSNAWYMLAVLVIVYIFNFVDRQLLTILAPDLKQSLQISDSQFGFLYGTTFGVFYALFGIPLGKLADSCSRVKLLAVGLGFWSLMTAASGLSRNFVQLAGARVGVGIGEATLSPCTYSLISDTFPPHRRATALGIYSTGLYIGTALSLILGGRIIQTWGDWFPAGSSPLGLSAWQAAFLLIGAPGVVLSVLVATLREPRRGTYDNPRTDGDEVVPKPDWQGFLKELSAILPPLTLIAAAKRGPISLTLNLIVAAAIMLVAVLLIWITGDVVQWIALGIGCYAVQSWLASARAGDAVAYTAVVGSRSFMGVALGYALLSFLGYANFAFAPLYAIRTLGAQPQSAGLMLGALGALGGTIGVVGGGLLADRLAKSGNDERRIQLTAIAASGTMIGHAIMFSATSLDVFYPVAFVTLIFMSASLAGASGTVVNITRHDIRGQATAVFLLCTNLFGLALGPYTAGKLSEAGHNLGRALASLSLLLPLTLACLAMALTSYRKAT